ncbi:FecR family protein [Formosa sp. A9]|uniref:FecR family protein n=1 Tax=Formosa sp. A9 TaxID=3442641 RepID=UPI003EB952B5
MNQHIISILKQLQQGENVDLYAIKHLSTEDKTLIEDLLKQNLVGEALEFIENTSQQNQWHSFKSKLKEQKHKRRKPYFIALKYAAIIIVLFGVFLFSKNPTQQPAEHVVNNEKSIELILENGEVQRISATDSQEIALTNGNIIGSQNGNQLNYKKSELKKLVYNELKIPNGKRFSIALSDETLVHLNAGSSLRYPVNFIAGQPREVYLSGEGYFNVTKDTAHPFIVHADAVNVKVLGTSFNVSAYPKASNIETVLVEGAVQLFKNETPDQKTVLEPGYMAESKKTESAIGITKVNTALYTSWISGDLIFKKTPFTKMLDCLERSYDVKIINNNENLNALNFNASFNVNIESISDIMEILSEMQSFKYTIKDKIILIE